jgi:hypothetical protein
MQIDYLAVLSDPRARDQVLDGATVELSLKLVADVSDHVTGSVKVCVACHGLEVGLAMFEIRPSDSLSVRVGRFTPAFGNFPLRHDPANHRTSDKPLPYDMGRMLHLNEWNEGILPAPWVDNGIELVGNVVISDRLRLDYAAHAVAGPKGSNVGFDFEYALSRTPESYYVDNNSEPSAGGRIAATVDVGGAFVDVGGSTMFGRYDPDAELGFVIVGAEATVETEWLAVRAEYLVRWTEFALGEDPAARLAHGPRADGTYDDSLTHQGFYAEATVPLGDIDVIGRWDGLHRAGNALAGSRLSPTSRVLRYTAGLAWRLIDDLRLKTSIEAYDFTDFDDELALHLGLVGAL